MLPEPPGEVTTGGRSDHPVFDLAQVACDEGPTPMNASTHPDHDPDKQASQLLDVLIRAGLILALVLLCYQVFAPFLVLMVWAVILAVSLYPLHQALARRIGGRQGLAATAITVLGVALIVAPTRRAHDLDGRLGA